MTDGFVNMPERQNKPDRRSIVRGIIAIAVIIVLLAAFPIAVLSVGFCGGVVFDETYYGQLARMKKRLKGTDGKRIIFIGNSAVAFGVNAELVTNELPDYTAVCFGLYGAIGTRAMTELALPEVREGDIVIMMPEMYAQSMSMYFSAREYLYACDSDFELADWVVGDERNELALNFVDFTAEKFSYISKLKKPRGEGVYSRAAFDGVDGEDMGYMTYVRPYNTMQGGFDVNSRIDFDTELFGDEFISYLNDSYVRVLERGATMYYGFAPVNRPAIGKGEPTDIMNYRDFLGAELKFPLLGEPQDSIMDWEWFYDNNVHTNSAGMTVFTRIVVEQLKTALHVSSDTNIELPDKPIPPENGTIEGDNRDADCFVYENDADGLIITGVTEKGADKTELILPSVVDGKQVTGLAATAFNGNTRIMSITVPESIRLLRDGSFDGCTALTRITLLQRSPNMIGVGSNLLKGAPSASVYVPRDVIDIYSTHYNWGAYRDKLRAY